MIYQTHKDHGKHISYSPQEEKTNIENGWVTVTEQEFYNSVPRETLRDTLVSIYVEKFGEKPHHRMTESSIQAKLDE